LSFWTHQVSGEEEELHEEVWGQVEAPSRRVGVFQAHQRFAANRALWALTREANGEGVKVRRGSSR